jgi:hypothetical protein
MTIFSLSQVQSAFSSISPLPGYTDKQCPILSFTDAEDYWYLSTSAITFEEWLAHEKENHWVVVNECGVSDCFFLDREGDEFYTTTEHPFNW